MKECADCGNDKKTDIGLRCSLCSSKHNAAKDRVARANESPNRTGYFKTKTAMKTMWTIRVFNHSSDRWDIYIGGTKFKAGAKTRFNRRQWESMDEIVGFFLKRHPKIFKRYPFAVFYGTKKLKNLN